MNKDMFFYSNFCQQCKEVISLITKKNLRDFFVFVSVDKNFNLPQCITHVPTIITRNKDLLIDDNVILYINKITNSKITTNEDISPYSISAGGYSSSFTMLTENGYDTEGAMSKPETNNFSLLIGGGEGTEIYTPKDDSGTSAKGAKPSKFDDSMYERYLNSRSSDDDAIKKQMNNTPGARQSR